MLAANLIDDVMNMTASVPRAGEGRTKFGLGRQIGGQIRGQRNIQTQGNGECFGRNGTLKGLHELPEKLDHPMHMQGIQVDRSSHMQGHVLQIVTKADMQ